MVDVNSYVDNTPIFELVKYSKNGFQFSLASLCPGIWGGGVSGRVLGGVRACTVSTRKTLIKLISLAIFLPVPRTLVWPIIGKS